MAHKRINFLGVPIDIIPEEELSGEIMEMVTKKEFSQICFVTIWDVLKARMNQEYKACLQNASLVIPLSKSILKGAKFLKLQVPVRYNIFKTVINILNVIDNNFWTLYLLGGKKEALRTVEKNIKSTFHSIHVVGRFTGYYQKNVEGDIIEAIHKASPSLLLSSDGVYGGDLWAYRHKDQLPKSIFMYYKDCFGVFLKRKHRVSDSTFNKGLEIWSDIARNPFKIFLIFPYLWYILVLLWYKISKKSIKNAEAVLPENAKIKDEVDDETLQ